MSVGPDIHFGKDAVVLDTLTRFVRSKIVPVVREKRAIIPDIYKELILRFNNHSELTFRVYNDAVAYRFSATLSGEITVKDEEASFNFRSGTVAYYPQVTKRTDADIFHTSFEEPYTTASLDTISEKMFAFTPVLLQQENLPNVLITESDVDDYPGMFLVKGTGTMLKGRFAPYPLKEIVSGGEFRQKIVTERVHTSQKQKAHVISRGG